MNVSYSGTTLEIGDTSVELRSDIKNAVVFDDVVVVLLEEPEDGDDPQNVLGLDASANVNWEIEPVSYRDSEKRAPYANLAKKDGRLIVGGWNSYQYEVDPATGDLTELGFYR